MKIRSVDAEEEPQINLTAMIDTFMLLLIFFMLATNFAQIEKDMDVALPPAESGELAQQIPDEIVVNLTKDGRLVLLGKEVDEAALQSTLQAAAQKDPKTPVTIRGDKEVNHGRVVAVMDACGIAGLTNLQIGVLDEGT
jgi:biopolymer transport protein ExbD